MFFQRPIARSEYCRCRHVPGPVFFVRSRSSRALALSGVGEKGGARLLGRAAVRPFYNTINDLKNRLRMLRERGGSLAELPRPPAY
jgi:hypothetical protein